MKGIWLLCCIVLLLAGCSKSDYEKAVSGTWQEKAIIGKFAGTSHWIRFNPEAKTFEMKLSVFTDMMDTGQVACSDNRTDYVKGTYAINGTHIRFEGRYCDQTFNQLIPNCRGTETYQKDFSMTFVANDFVFDFEKDDYYKVWLVKQ